MLQETLLSFFSFNVKFLKKGYFKNQNLFAKVLTLRSRNAQGIIYQNPNTQLNGPAIITWQLKLTLHSVKTILCSITTT